MAQVTTRKVVEGLGNLVLHVFLQSDGSGELTNYVLLSPTDLVPPLKANAPTFRVVQAWYAFTWFDITISYGGVVPRPVWNFARDAGCHIDFRSFGGISDYPNVPPSDQNGRLLISTNGFAQLGSQGSIVLEIRKP